MSDSPTKFLRAYPDTLRGVEGNILVFSNGERLPFTSSRQKDYFEALSNPDIADHLRIAYPTGPDSFGVPEVCFDPGRFRNEGFFKAMYGSTEEEVQRSLVKIVWMPKTVDKRVLVSTVNGVDKKLTLVSDALDRLPAELKRHVDDVEEKTFEWRLIEQNDVWKRVSLPLRSVHSFGIAIDIRPKEQTLRAGIFDYWVWHREEFERTGRFTHPSRLAKEIVEVFEKHGFIWGGKWFHFDPMHFEYRPELLVK
jgi:peptidoglycan L-alanyl-D-glutamate endopeptidase CwlK